LSNDGGLRQLFQRHLRTWHWQSVETFSTGQGVPDLNYCVMGIEGWIELKRAEANAVSITPEQVGWAERRLRAGGRVFLAVRQQTTQGPRKGPASDVLWLFRGSSTRLVKEYGLMGATPLGRWENGPTQWQWTVVEKYLTT
jgi:hypothetical protein